MAIQIDGTTVIDDSRNITNVVSANVTSLSIGGTAVTASVAELNHLVGVNTSSTIQERIDALGFTANTLIQTFAAGQSANLTVYDTSLNSLSPLGILKDVSGTLTSAIPGVDYTYTYTSNTNIIFTALTAGDYNIRVLGRKDSLGLWNSLIELYEIGNPTTSLTSGSVPSTFSTLSDGQSNWVYAVDIANFDSTDRGYLFEVGGGVSSGGISVAMTDVEGNDYLSIGIPGFGFGIPIAEYHGSDITLYLSIDYSTPKFQVFLAKESNLNQLISHTSPNQDYASTSASSLGRTVDGTGTPYQGAITGWREWQNTYFDFAAYKAANS
jgi:hypothetical protein